MTGRASASAIIIGLFSASLVHSPGLAADGRFRGPTRDQSAARLACPLAMMRELIQAGRCLVEDDFQRALVKGATRLEGAMLAEAPNYGWSLLGKRQALERLGRSRTCPEMASSEAMNLYRRMREQGVAGYTKLVDEIIDSRPQLKPYDCL